jgi:hypothetical protein
LERYRAQDWRAAQSLAQTLGDTYDEMRAFYEMLSQRMKTYQTTPPGDDWDGHYIALSK